MTPKTKEELAEEYTNTDYFRLEYSTFGTTAKECQKAFLAGFQKSEEMHKELLGQCEAFLAKHSRDVDILIQPEKSVIEASKLLQKIRMRDGR